MLNIIAPLILAPQVSPQGLRPAPPRRVATARSRYPASDTPITLSALRSNDVIAIVKPLRYEENQPRIVLGGKLPENWTIDTVAVVSSADSTLPRMLQVLTPSAPTPKKVRIGGISFDGPIQTGSPASTPDPNATFLLVARRASRSALGFDAPWTHLQVGKRLVGTLRTEAPNEVGGFLLVRTNARAVEGDANLSRALVKTLVKGLANGDEECVRQASETIVRAQGFAEDPIERQWFQNEGRSLVRAAANRRKGYERLCLESAWQATLDWTPWASAPIVDALEELVASGRPLDLDEEALMQRITVGQIGTPFVKTATLARRAPQEWIRAKLAAALPEPKDENQYKMALALTDDPSEQVLAAVTGRLSQWSKRPDLSPFAQGAMHTPSAQELRQLAGAWKKVRFLDLKRSERVIPQRREGIPIMAIGTRRTR